MILSVNLSYLNLSDSHMLVEKPRVSYGRKNISIGRVFEKKRKVDEKNRIRI